MTNQMADRIVLTDWNSDFLPVAEALLAELKEQGVLVIAFTAGDRAELEPVREQLNWTDPFITENGSGIFTPVDHNPFAEPLGEQDGHYYVQELGCPYVQARAALRVLANVISHPLKGFGDFTVPQLQKFLGVSEDAAHRAKAREFSEPFMTPKAVETSLLVQAAEEMGFGVVLNVPEESRFSQLIGAEAGVGVAIGQVVEACQKSLNDGRALRVLGVSRRESDISEFFGESLSERGVPVDLTTGVATDANEWEGLIRQWLAG